MGSECNSLSHEMSGIKFFSDQNKRGILIRRRESQILRGAEDCDEKKVGECGGDSKAPVTGASGDVGGAVSTLNSQGNSVTTATATATAPVMTKTAVTVTATGASSIEATAITMQLMNHH